MHLGIAADGELNLARLITDATGGSEKAPEGAFGTLAVHTRGGSRSATACCTQRPLGTTPAGPTSCRSIWRQHLNPCRDTGVKVVALGFGDGGGWRAGSPALNPRRQGRLTIQDYSPRLAWRFLRDEFDLQQPTGRPNGRADYDFSMAGGAPRLHVSDPQRSVRSASRSGAANQPLARLQSLALEDGSFDLDGNRARIGRRALGRGIARDTAPDVA